MQKTFLCYACAAILHETWDTAFLDPETELPQRCLLLKENILAPAGSSLGDTQSVT